MVWVQPLLCLSPDMLTGQHAGACGDQEIPAALRSPGIRLHVNLSSPWLHTPQQTRAVTRYTHTALCSLVDTMGSPGLLPTPPERILCISAIIHTHSLAVCSYTNSLSLDCCKVKRKKGTIQFIAFTRYAKSTISFKL